MDDSPAAAAITDAMHVRAVHPLSPTHTHTPRATAAAKPSKLNSGGNVGAYYPPPCVITGCATRTLIRVRPGYW